MPPQAFVNYLWGQLIVWPWVLLFLCLNFMSLKWGQYHPSKAVVRSKWDSWNGAKPTWRNTLASALEVKSTEALFYASYAFILSEQCQGMKSTVIPPPFLIRSRGGQDGTDHCSHGRDLRWLNLRTSLSVPWSLPGSLSLSVSLTKHTLTHS